MHTFGLFTFEIVFLPLYYRPDKALAWLDFLEFEQPEKLKKIRPGTLKNLKCRADCQLENCCAIMGYKKALKIHQLNEDEDRFLFNYNNDSMQ